MITSEKMRFGLIGAGAIAQAYLQAFRQSSVAALVGVADARLDAAKTVADAVGCSSFKSAEQMLEAMQLDAAVVCTPPVTHPEICTRLVGKGIHVLCEKPLAIEFADAQQMLRAAADAGVKLSMASKFRHVEDVIRAKSIVKAGILGDILLFENSFTAHVDMSRRWNSDPSISGGGVLIDNGTHSVDIMRYFLGPIVELHAFEGKRVQELPVEDTVRLFVRSATGIMGSIDLSWSMNKERPYYIGIYGSEGTVLVGWQESKYRRTKEDKWIVFGSGYNKVEAFCRQIDNFVGAIRGEQALVVTPTDSLASVQVIEAAYRALRRTTWDKIPSTEIEASIPSPVRAK